MDKESLELRLLLLDIEHRVGNSTAGRALAVECRGLADTAARYRQWLEAAVAFHNDFDTLAAFLERGKIAARAARSASGRGSHSSGG